MFYVHLDNDARHYLGVAANQRDFFVAQRLGLFPKQLTAALEGNRLGSRIRTIYELHGAPLERESGLFVLCWVAPARRLGAGTPMSVERRCGRDADSKTRDVRSGAVIARAADRAIDQLIVEGTAAWL